MDINSLISVITATTSTLAIVIAVLSVWNETRQGNKALGATVLRDFEKEFVSEDFKRERYTLAKFLYNRKPNQILPPDKVSVLDFFDTVGIYLKRNILDTEITWNTYFYWVGHYYFLCKDDVLAVEKRNGGVLYLENLKYLYTSLYKHGRRYKKLPPETEYFTSSRTLAFLE